MITFSKKQKSGLSDREIHRLLKKIGLNTYIIIKEVHFIVNDSDQLKFDENIPLEADMKKLIGSDKTGKFYLFK